MRTFIFNTPMSAPAPPNAIDSVAFYDSIRDVPMFRLNEFQIHLCEDAGIGSTLEDFDRRLENMQVSLGAGDTANASTELYNTRLGLFLMLDRVSTAARCLADLVYSINGVPIADFSDDALMEVHRQITERMSLAEVAELIDDLKKKFKRELKVAFPSLFPDDEEMQFYANIIRRALLQIEDTLNHETETPNPAISEIDKWLRAEMRPENFDFDSPENAVDSKRRDFEQVCTALAMAGIQNAETLTAYKFHSRIQYLNEHKNPTQKDGDN